ncbi:tetratricopeptide repeat protein [Bernardetia sp. OM2101]|uniref:tetratricopeptide repeat protein n=1 Tax=Bernardetia sp. OM2101 TaxID=3344876 RepID=UPI0035D051C3
MKLKINILLVLSFLSFSCQAQNLENSRDKIDKAEKELSDSFTTFFSTCLSETDCKKCVDELANQATDEYKMYLIGTALYNIDEEKSFELHKKAIELKPNELNFSLEYAMQLHRKGLYKEAIPYYLAYQKQAETDYRIDLWLSECYLNSGEKDKAIKSWNACNHAKNHVGIDKAIYLIHGRTDQIKKRSELRLKMQEKNEKSTYDLIFLDLNWEIDWWNTLVQEFFLEKDLELIAQTYGKSSEIYLDLNAYSSIKKMSKGYGKSDSIKTLLSQSEMIIDNNRFFPNGNITSDLLNIAFTNKILDEKTFFDSRKDEIISLADSTKDIELLNIYAYLEATVNGKVSEETDKKGWNEYKDERFAMSYFMGLAEKNTYDNPDLEKALSDFPNSALMQFVKMNCAYIEDREFEEDLIELIKKEFRTLATDPTRYSYRLKGYFHLLENGK